MNDKKDEQAVDSNGDASEFSALLCVGDLVVLIRRLAHSLNKASPGSVLVKQAMDYLKRAEQEGGITRDVYSVVDTGNFKIWKNGNLVFIENKDREAGGFDTDLFEKCISDHFDNNF